MKEGRPSITAIYVSFGRSVATYDRELSKVCRDEAAEKLLPRALGKLIERAKAAPSGQRTLRALRMASLGMFEHLALRTRLIDDAVNEAVQSGTQQLVLLGAGLDGRAHRLAQLRDSVVFEVDFPSTQQLKRRKAVRLPSLAKEVRYAACDFERVSLSDALLRAGFRPGERSVWVWEGVTMYLAPSHVEDSLDAIATLSAPGSRLVTTYATHQLSRSGSLFTSLALIGLRAVAEPIRAQFEPNVMAELLRRRDFSVVSDVRPLDLLARYDVRMHNPDFGAPGERLFVADKRPERDRARSTPTRSKT